ncbi:zinc finger protein 189-like [Oppia nitens]|uniref:zinc finger protein 189-like n=1 Tax=Oppia nitens TaxID=1686743 RepID=UPI0023DB9AAF|nr:zinc finger protein 189-like [Oppia nitens]XP_054161619.1 zinc finger protein 189-like [Oppia nitens]
MDSSGEQHFDLSEYRVISIEDNHKVAMINTMNGIVTDPPVVDFADIKSMIYKLRALIQMFDDSFITSCLNDNKLKTFESVTEADLTDISQYIRNWLISFYNAESQSLIESLKLEDGIQEVLSMAALLILNVFRMMKDSIPDVREALDENWMYLQEFDDQLEAMWKSDKAFTLLQTELECERIQRLADRQKLTKLEKEVNTYKRKVQQSKEMLEKLKKFASKPAPKSRKRGGGVQTPSRRGRRKGEQGWGTRTESEIEPDLPPLPGTPVLLSSSGTGSSCRYCGKWFNDSAKLAKHIIIHAGSKPFACDWPGCGRPFDSNYKLQRHRRCHTGERPFACETCDKRFTRSDKLREHQRLHLRDSTVANQKQIEININPQEVEQQDEDDGEEQQQEVEDGEEEQPTHDSVEHILINTEEMVTNE